LAGTLGGWVSGAGVDGVPGGVALGVATGVALGVALGVAVGVGVLCGVPAARMIGRKIDARSLAAAVALPAAGDVDGAPAWRGCCAPFGASIAAEMGGGGKMLASWPQSISRQSSLLKRLIERGRGVCAAGIERLHWRDVGLVDSRLRYFESAYLPRRPDGNRPASEATRSSEPGGKQTAVRTWRSNGERDSNGHSSRSKTKF
jgi:hypothetical protein